jgi:hypothetical protein
MIGEGWSTFHAAHAAHYFVQGVSLCGRFKFWAEPDGNPEGMRHCKECEKKVKVREERR